jgi:hypothetical protein
MPKSKKSSNRNKKGSDDDICVLEVEDCRLRDISRRYIITKTVTVAISYFTVAIVRNIVGHRMYNVHMYSVKVNTLPNVKYDF